MYPSTEKSYVSDHTFYSGVLQAYQCLSGFNEVVERANSLLKRGVTIRSVSVQQVDILKVQTRQRRIRALDQMLPAQTTVVHRVVTVCRTPVDLCRDDQVVALPAKLLDCLSHADLALAASVALGAVEEVDC